nr:MAG TPA: hypothetical protein [Caudoviricetes sp.]
MKSSFLLLYPKKMVPKHLFLNLLQNLQNWYIISLETEGYDSSSGYTIGNL